MGSLRGLRRGGSLRYRSSSFTVLDFSNRLAWRHLPDRRRDVTAYTKVNLKEVEDQAVRFGLAPNIEARMARVDLEL